MIPTPTRLCSLRGNQRTLESLGNEILRHASGESGCGRQFYRTRFSATASHGLYLHLLPCDHPTDASERAAGRKPKSGQGCEVSPRASRAKIWKVKQILKRAGRGKPPVAGDEL